MDNVLFFVISEIAKDFYASQQMALRHKEAIVKTAGRNTHLR